MRFACRPKKVEDHEWMNKKAKVYGSCFIAGSSKMLFLSQCYVLLNLVKNLFILFHYVCLVVVAVQMIDIHRFYFCCATVGVSMGILLLLKLWPNRIWPIFVNFFRNFKCKMNVLQQAKLFMHNNVWYRTLRVTHTLRFGRIHFRRQFT